MKRNYNVKSPGHERQRRQAREKLQAIPDEDWQKQRMALADHAPEVSDVDPAHFFGTAPAGRARL